MGWKSSRVRYVAQLRYDRCALYCTDAALSCTSTVLYGTNAKVYTGQRHFNDCARFVQYCTAFKQYSTVCVQYSTTFVQYNKTNVRTVVLRNEGRATSKISAFPARNHPSSPSFGNILLEMAPTSTNVIPMNA